MGKRTIPHGLAVIPLNEINRPRANRITAANPDTEFNVPVEASAPKIPGTASNRPWLASRGDTPVCNFSRKARRIDDNDWTPALRNSALEMLRRDYTASSAKGPTASVLKTWEAMRQRMHDGNVPVYPLTPSEIARVAAAFKWCGYRSFSNYMSRAIEVHIDMYGFWGADLALEARRSCRSVTRGIGPATQGARLKWNS